MMMMMVMMIVIMVIDLYYFAMIEQSGHYRYVCRRTSVMWIKTMMLMTKEQQRQQVM